MRIIRPNVEILEQGPGLSGIFKQIEQAGRNCYQSSHLIGEDTARPFVDRMIRDGHTAMLEHGTVYLQLPASSQWARRFEMEPFSATNWLSSTDTMFVTTNYRVIVERCWQDALEYLCDPEPLHERRVTARFDTQIAISREYNRHRVNSVAESSTRYCNYSKDKFGNEISINLPTWIDFDDATNPCFILEERLKHCAENFGEELWDAIDYWLFANAVCEYCYMMLIKKGWTAQQARTILPLDTNTSLVHTAFVSDWQHFFDLRSRGTTGKPHPDAKVLADQLLQMFIDKGIIRK